MSAKREILVAVLKLTREGPIDYSLISKNARIPTETGEKLLRNLADNGFVRFRAKVLEVSPDQRVRIAVEALRLGADFEKVCWLLDWREFESIATKAFETYSFTVAKNFRFKERRGKRWEIDLLACRHPLVVSVDCKHWQHRWTSSPIVRVTEEHVERTRAFANTLPTFYMKLGLGKWKSAKIVPAVLSLLPAPFKFHQGIPIVPVLQLQNFLNELYVHMDLLTYFTQELVALDKKIAEY